MRVTHLLALLLSFFLHLNFGPTPTATRLRLLINYNLLSTRRVASGGRPGHERDPSALARGTGPLGRLLFLGLAAALPVLALAAAEEEVDGLLLLLELLELLALLLLDLLLVELLMLLLLLVLTWLACLLQEHLRYELAWIAVELALERAAQPGGQLLVVARAAAAVARRAGERVAAVAGQQAEATAGGGQLPRRWLAEHGRAATDARAEGTRRGRPTWRRAAIRLERLETSARELRQPSRVGQRVPRLAQVLLMLV